MALNVLLMLSSRVKPHPTEVEMPFHVKECKAGRTAYVITNQVVSEIKKDERKPKFPMTPGQSVVAFYVDKPLKNDLLAQGVFVSFIRFDSPQGKSIFQHHGLYNANNIPKNPKGFVEVRNLSEALPGATLDTLDGIIEASGLVLTVDNLPDGAARLKVYYRCPTP